MRSLAIDFGTRRIGLALSATGGQWATPHEVLAVTDPQQAIAPIQKLIATEDVARVVVGLPLNMDGSIGPSAEKTVAWARQLLASLPTTAAVQLVFVDERLSSFDAEQQLNSRRRAGERLTRGGKKKQLDAVAAAGFLQEFLDGTLRPIEVDGGAPQAWQRVIARVLRGHQVASGRNGDPRFPGGTLRMQQPFFAALGLDLSPFFPGTLNVSVAPMQYQIVRSRLTFRDVKWHPTAPAEDFSFFDVRLIRANQPPVEGLIYYPHPDTKPEHFQQPDVLELLLPFVQGLPVSMEITLEVPAEQLRIEHTPA